MGDWKINISESTYGSGLWLLGLCLIVLSLSGCVKRQMLIRSFPEGALVTVDSQTLGNAPLQVPFTYYGTREIHLEKDGYQTVKVKQNIKAPWWQIPPLDFITDNFAFRELRDQRVLDFQMQPQELVDENQLINRGNELRNNSQRDTIAVPIVEREKPEVISR